jgi:hypothetical protein
VVDGSGLENRRARKGTGGSNPSLSARIFTVSNHRFANSPFCLFLEDQIVSYLFSAAQEKLRGLILRKQQTYNLRIADRSGVDAIFGNHQLVCQTRPRANRRGIRFCWHACKLTRLAWKPVRYAAVGGPNQVVSASASPTQVRSPTQATYPSGRTRTAAGAVTAPIAGRSQIPAYSASIN